MATVSTPVATWVATIMAGTAVNQSSSLTATLNITAGLEVYVPVAVQFSNVSADPVVFIYRSMDGGTTYDTTSMGSFSIGKIATGKGQASIVLATGQYALQLLNSGPNTATIMVLTQLVITAINNV